jgi:hypothetical protein
MKRAGLNDMVYSGAGSSVARLKNIRHSSEFPLLKHLGMVYAHYVYTVMLTM